MTDLRHSPAAQFFRKRIGRGRYERLELKPGPTLVLLHGTDRDGKSVTVEVTMTELLDFGRARVA